MHQHVCLGGFSHDPNYGHPGQDGILPAGFVKFPVRSVSAPGPPPHGPMG